MNRRRLTAAATVVVASGLLPLATGGAADAATPPIRITKIHYGQSGSNLDTEYIVFKNTTSKTRYLTGWRIISAPQTDNQYYVFPSTAVKPGATVTLYTGKGTNSVGKRYWGSADPRWDNDGDKAILRNKAGTTVDTCQYIGGGTVAYC